MRKPVYGSKKLLAYVTETLRMAGEQVPVIIGIDGRKGAGTSSVAAWLGWQLGLPVISLDLYRTDSGSPLDWRYQEITRVLESGYGRGYPVIVEGICLCQVLQELGEIPDFLVWVQNDGQPEPGLEEPTTGYINKFDPVLNADFTLAWHEPEPA